MLAGPLLILGLGLVARSARGRIFGIAAGAVLLVAVMRLPLSGYAAQGGKRDSPLLGGVFWLEDRLSIGAGAQIVAFSAAGLILCSIVLLKVSKAVVPICLVIAIGAGAAASFAGMSYYVARAHNARTTFLPADPQLGRFITPASVPPRCCSLPATIPGRLDAPLLEHLARARRAARRGRAGRLLRDRQGGDHRRRNRGGRRGSLTGPVLVEEYGAAAQLEHARLITRTTGTSLWVPASQARIASLTEGLYLDGWLSYPSRIRVSPSSLGGTDTMRFTLSLPATPPPRQSR